MNNQAIQEIKVKIVPVLKRAGIKRSAVFGSLARGESREESDIDILVEFEKEKTLFDFVELKRELEVILGKRVDLITYRSLSPFLRERILREQIPLT